MGATCARRAPPLRELPRESSFISLEDKDEWKKEAEQLFEKFDRDDNGVLEKDEYQDVVEKLTTYMMARLDETWGKQGISYSCEDVKRSLQSDLDEHDEGIITKADFLANMEKILARLDGQTPDKDHLQELLAGVDAAEWGVTAERLFDEFDEDGNGVLEKDEYKNVVEQFTQLMVTKWGTKGIKYPKEHMRIVLQGDLDEDCDDVITKEEFMKATRNMLDKSDCMSFVGELKINTLLDRMVAEDEEGWQKAAEQVFEWFDKDGNRQLEKQEYQDIVETLATRMAMRLDENYDKEDLKTTLKWDLDEDYDGIITHEEFMGNVKKLLTWLQTTNTAAAAQPTPDS